MEVTLYNRNGKPVAYVADDGQNSIYLWSGHAVAYVYEDKIYGWSGRHLGWFIDGIIYDLRGLKVGFTHSKCPVAIHAESAKYAKYGKYAKYARYAPHTKPALGTGYSDKDLEAFFQAGRAG